MANRIQQRRDTAANWAKYNPILLEGEVGYVLDNPNQYKIGDGEHAWNDLPLRGYTGTIVQTIGDSEDAVMSQKAVTDLINQVYNNFSGYSNIEIDINSVGARIITPDNYSKDNPSYFIIHCHGNGQNHNTLPSTTAQQWMRQNNIGFASIDIQDYVSEPFESDASGWGNYITYNRIIQLYNYLVENYAVKGIIMAGSSMGGLTMGEIAYRKPFNILFCLGLGVVPGVEIIWNNAPSRKPAIRNAYGMNPDGTDDSQISEFVSGYDWYKMGMTTDNKKIGFTNMYLYYGDDNTFRVDFGGVEQYTELKDAILAAGTYCTIKQVGPTDTGHADSSIWDAFISDNIFEKELGI